MNRSYQRGPQGVRSDRYSGSKVTNLTRFQPYYSATEKIYARYLERFRNRTYPWVQVETIHDDFVFPITKKDLLSSLEKVPAQFVEGIRAVLVLSGSRKQITVMKKLLMFGEYWRECVFLHPYPKVLMHRIFDKKPNPNVIREYQRAGAKVTAQRTGIEIRFDKRSLKTFYLNDVLMHEIGHHNGLPAGRKPGKRREAFARWFVSEYGYRLDGKIKGSPLK